jgi:hypothetical protein
MYNDNQRKIISDSGSFSFWINWMVFFFFFLVNNWMWKFLFILFLFFRKDGESYLCEVMVILTFDFF